MKLLSLLFIASAFAQSFSPGIPLPGLPKSLGQKTSANSTSVTIASDQAAIPITGAITVSATSASLGAYGSTMPITGTAVGFKDPSGNMQPITLTATGALPVKNSGITGSGSAASATVSTVVTLSAPATAIGFVLMNLDTSSANIRWAVGRTASATLGEQLQPGRDSGFVPVGANLSVCSESGTQNYDVQWVSQ